MAYWVLPAFLVSLGAGPAQLGLIEGLAESVASFAKLFSGYLTDRLERRKPLVVAGYFVANGVKPLLAVVTAWWHILLIRFSDRLAKGVRGAPRDVMVAESVGKNKLGSAYGLIQSLDSAGAIAGPLPPSSCSRDSEFEPCSGPRQYPERWRSQSRYSASGRRNGEAQMKAATCNPRKPRLPFWVRLRTECRHRSTLSSSP